MGTDRRGSGRKKNTFGIREKIVISCLQDMPFHQRHSCYPNPWCCEANIDHDIKTDCYCLILTESDNLYC